MPKARALAMAIWRTFLVFSPDVTKQIGVLLASKYFEGQILQRWQLDRLKAVELANWATLSHAAKTCSLSRQTVATYRDIVLKEGVVSLLDRKRQGGGRSTLSDSKARELRRLISGGSIKNFTGAATWIEEQTGKRMSESGIRRLVARMQLNRWR